MATRKIFRDYRPGHKGRFVSEETYNRSRAQNEEAEEIEEEDVPVSNPVIDDFDDFYDYEDYEDYYHEIHATGDTGKKGK